MIPGLSLNAYNKFPLKRKVDHAFPMGISGVLSEGKLFQLEFEVISAMPLCYILTFDPAQKYYSKVIHRKEVTHSNGQ